METVRGYVGAPLKATVQFLPEAVTKTVSFRQSPPQPAKVEPAAGLGIRVMNVPTLKRAEQMAPQLIPAGREVTSPEPAPLFETVTVPGLLNVAVQIWAVPETVTMPELVQSPLQPAKLDPAAGEGVRVTDEPKANAAEQEVPQLIPAGEDVTEPEPVPLFETERPEMLRAPAVATLPVALSMRQVPPLQ